MSRNARSARKRGRLGISKLEKVAFPVIVFLAIWVVYSVMQPGPAGPPQTTAVLTTSGSAPDFTLPVVGSNGLTGQSVSLSSFRGKIVLLEFMEPWCPHCQTMAPTLQTMHNQYGDSVVFISVAGPVNGATAQDAANFIRTYGTTWTYLYDSSGTIALRYGVSGTPTFFVVNKSGIVVASLPGEQSPQSLSAAISQASS